MTLSVLGYALFSGACGLATAAWHLTALRFLAALGMGGEWALGVALVMEVWPDRARGLLAGLIGTAANLGFMLIALLALGLAGVLGWLQQTLLSAGLSAETVDRLTGHSGWRVLMFLGAVPALMAFPMRLFVPESARWLHERARGAAAHWAAGDLAGVAVGALAAGVMIALWAADLPNAVRVPGTLLALAVVTAGFLYPAYRYLGRSGGPAGSAGATLRRMLLGAVLSGIPLVTTWGSILWAPAWADRLTGGSYPEAKAYTQTWSALGAVFGTAGGSLLGDWLGRRAAYVLLIVASLATTLLFFLTNDHFGPYFLATIGLAGTVTAAFYGWLPLYLPELFPTRIRATGQGFSFNFGRVIAAVGALQMVPLLNYFGGGQADPYPLACSALSLIYLAGLVVIWFAPETRGKPLPE
jgi:MFS family permease